MMQRIINTIVLLTSLTLALSAQDALYLTLDDLILRTKKDNLSIQKSQMNIEVAKAEWNKSKEWWLPSVFVGTNIHHLNGRALNSDGRFFVDVDRQSRWYGGEVNIDLNIGNGIYGSKVQKLKVDQAIMQSEIDQNTVILKSISTYYELLKISAQKQIYAELRNNKESLIQQLESQVNVGLALESDLLLAKSKASRLNVIIKELDQHYRYALSNMALALNISDGSNLFVDLNDLKKIDLIKSDEIGTSNISNHPEYRSAQIKAEAEENLSKGITTGLLIPQVGVRYSYGPFGFDYSDNQLTRVLQGYLGWNIPIGQLVYGGDSKISKAKSKLNQLDLQFQKESLTQRITQYQAQLNDAEEMVTMTEEGVNYARQALEKSNERLSEGLGKLYEVILAEEEFKESQLQQIEAIINYNLTQYLLWDALGRKI